MEPSLVRNFGQKLEIWSVRIYIFTLVIELRQNLFSCTIYYTIAMFAAHALLEVVHTKFTTFTTQTYVLHSRLHMCGAGLFFFFFFSCLVCGSLERKKERRKMGFSPTLVGVML